MNNTEVVCFSTPRKVRKKVDDLRGDASRSKFITRAIEAFLKEDEPAQKKLSDCGGNPN